MNNNILVFGENGQISSELRRLTNKNNNYYFLSSQKCNFLKNGQISLWIKKIKPSIIINTSAYTNVKKAEKESEKSFIINSKALQIISTEALKINATLIHFSTDFVFDGFKKSPYIESDLTNPLNVYGKTKLMGECEIQKKLNKFFILRTSWVHSFFGDNFLKKIINNAELKNMINVTNVEIGTPNSSNFLANSTLKIIDMLSIKSDHEIPYGLYHLSSLGEVSRYYYAKYILKTAQRYNFDLLCDPKAVKSFISKNDGTLRPKYSVLCSDLFKKTFDINIPRWQHGVIQSIRKLKNENE